eukprot:352930-Chlamydomonas_euryale.AAC.4
MPMHPDCMWRLPPTFAVTQSLVIDITQPLTFAVTQSLTCAVTQSLTCAVTQSLTLDITAPLTACVSQPEASGPGMLRPTENSGCSLDDTHTHTCDKKLAAARPCGKPGHAHAHAHRSIAFPVPFLGSLG